MNLTGLAPRSIRRSCWALQKCVSSSWGMPSEDTPLRSQQDTQQGTSDSPANLRAIPLRHSKVIHLIRHGQGFHNVAGHKKLDEYLSTEWEDAHLTDFGWQQAEALHKHINGLPERLQVDLVVSSPLTRTLETAVGVFANEEWRDKAHGPPLMTSQTSEQGHRVAREAMSTAGCPPFLAYELCREHLGRHPCDKRRNLSHYKKQFPAVDFSLIETEEDTLWGPDFREEKEEIKARGRRFMQWLMTRPEPRIAVVSHSSFLFFTMSGFGPHASERVQTELHRWYENCEMRTIVLSDDSGEGGLDPLWFPGGNQLERAGREASCVSGFFMDVVLNCTNAPHQLDAAPPEHNYEPPENAQPPPEVAVPSEIPEVEKTSS